MPAVDWQDNYIPEPNSGCHIWMGAVTRGYGMQSIEGQRHRMHRLFYEMHNGPIPDGMVACHRCDNPLCVNPDHIFIGTHADNVADRVKKGRTGDWSGEKHPNARLSWRDVVEIRRSRLSTSKLAAIYGVSQPHVVGIKRGRFWKNAGV